MKFIFVSFDCSFACRYFQSKTRESHLCFVECQFPICLAKGTFSVTWNFTDWGLTRVLWKHFFVIFLFLIAQNDDDDGVGRLQHSLRIWYLDLHYRSCSWIQGEEDRGLYQFGRSQHLTLTLWTQPLCHHPSLSSLLSQCLTDSTCRENCFCKYSPFSVYFSSDIRKRRQNREADWDNCEFHNLVYLTLVCQSEGWKMALGHSDRLLDILYICRNYLSKSPTNLDT